MSRRENSLLLIVYLFIVYFRFNSFDGRMGVEARNPGLPCNSCQRYPRFLNPPCKVKWDKVPFLFFFCFVFFFSLCECYTTITQTRVGFSAEMRDGDSGEREEGMTREGRPFFNRNVCLIFFGYLTYVENILTIFQKYS